MPYTAQRTGVQDAVGGQVDMVIVAAPVAQSLVASGQLRPIAVTSAQRLTDFPASRPSPKCFPASISPAGSCWPHPPARLPPSLDRMNKEVSAALNDATVLAKVRKMGFEIPGAGSLQEVNNYLHEQYAIWGKVVREIGVKPE